MLLPERSTWSITPWTSSALRSSLSINSATTINDSIFLWHYSVYILYTHFIQYKFTPIEQINTYAFILCTSCVCELVFENFLGPGRPFRLRNIAIRKPLAQTVYRMSRKRFEVLPNVVKNERKTGVTAICPPPLREKQTSRLFANSDHVASSDLLWDSYIITVRRIQETRLSPLPRLR